MTKARNISDLLDANGDVKSGALDNVPPSNDASALTTGTIDNARISLDANEIPSLDTAKITTGTFPDARLPSTALNSNVSVPNQSAFKNIIINGDMSIAQRATSTSGVTSSDGYYACDRWYSQTDIGTWTISQSTDVPTGQGFVNSFKMDCTSAGTSNADEVMIRSKHEGQNLQYLKYGTSSAESLTLSFWIKSNKTGNYYVAMANANTTQDRVVSFGYTIDSANTWEKKTITIPGDTSQGFDNNNVENLTIYWLFSAASGFTSGGVSNTWINYSASRFANSNLAGLGGSTSDEVYMTGVQLEAGTSASDFEFLPHDVNLQRCQRYYYLHVSGNGKHICLGTFYTSTLLTMALQFPTEMRTAPSLIKTSGTNYYIAYSNNSGDSFDDFTGSIQRPTTTGCGIDTNDGSKLAGIQGYGATISTGNANAYIAFNAEL
jgi:hypothetical protein